MTTYALTRRSALQGSLIAVIGAVGGYLVARNSSAARAPRGTTAANAYGAEPAHDRPLLAVNRVPAGGGVILADQRIVVTRDSAGAVHGFSAVCTHQGCTVDRVAGGTIDCPCHGSRFDVATGAVVGGPAPRPLPRVAVRVHA